MTTLFVRATRLLLWAGVCAFIASSCSKPAPQGKELARVNDRPLTKEMVDARTDNPSELTDAQVRMYANRWVISELLYQEAKRQGLDQSEAVKRSVEDAQKQLAVAALLEKEIIPVSAKDVPADQVEAYYEKHQDEFTAHDQTVWLGMAVFSERRAAERFRDRALSDAGWATAVSEARTSGALSSSADSLLHTQSTLYPSELWRLVTAMRLHDISPPVKTSAGFFVIRLLGSLKRGETMPLSSVEPKIRERLSVDLRQQKYSELVEALRRKNNVQIFYAEKDTLASKGE